MATTGSVNSNNILSALNAGSGIDTKALAQGLVDAQRMPRQTQIDNNIAKDNARISGFGAVSSSLSKLKDAFAALQDRSTLDAVTVQGQSNNSFSLSNGMGTAIEGTHEVQVLNVAKSQRSAFAGFASATVALNGGGSFDLTITPDATPTSAVTLNFSNASANDVVSKINNAGLGVHAELVNAGSGATPFQIVLTATATGTPGKFSASAVSTAAANSGAAIAELDYSTAQTQAAVDARVIVDGATLTRSGNTITDAVTGLTLNLYAASSTSSSFLVARDTAAVKANLTSLVAAYNDLKKTLDTVSDKSSADSKIGRSLVNDSLVQQIRSRVNGMLINLSSTPGSSIRSLSDLGIIMQRDGTLMLETPQKLDTALSANFADVAKMLSADIQSQAGSKAVQRGLAGDAFAQLTALVATKGPIATQQTAAGDDIKRNQTAQSDLQKKMTALLARYTKQFAAMDALVTNIKSQQSGLTTQFQNLSAMYNNKN